MTRALAITPLTDLTTWLRGRGLEIVLIVRGAPALLPMPVAPSR